MKLTLADKRCRYRLNIAICNLASALLRCVGNVQDDLNYLARTDGH
jgi:hypothetical protein